MEKNIPGRRNIQRKDLKVGEFLAYVRNSKEPAVIAGDRTRERVVEKVREETEGPSLVAITRIIVFTLSTTGGCFRI